MKKSLNTAAFFDTSVLVPALYQGHSHHHKARVFLTEYIGSGLTITISPQNVLEISTVLGGRYRVSSSEVAKLLDKFLDDPLVCVVYPNPGVVNRFLDLLRGEVGGSYYIDVFLAATALEYSLDTIVTNDRDFGKIKGIRVYNPFV